MPYNDRLFKLLRRMSERELDDVWTQALKNEPAKNDFKNRDKISKVELISKDLRSVAGHSLANVFRDDHELPWKQIVIDVADKLHPGLGWTSFELNDGYPETVIEDQILKYVDKHSQEAWEKLSKAEQIKLVADINQHIDAEKSTINDAVARAAIQSVTVDGVSTAMAAGLLTGGGLSLLISGTGAALVGGVLGGILTQIGLWLVLQFAGWWLGLKLIIGGGLGMLGFAAVAGPTALLGATAALMSPSYSKTIPAVILILSSAKVHSMFERGA